MGKGGGGGGSQTVNTQVEPPAYAKPFLEFGLAEAKEQYMGDMPGYYPGSTVVGFAPESQLALNMVRDRALAGSPLISGAQNTINTAATGGFVNPALAGYGGFARGGGGIGLGADVFRSAAAGGLRNEALPFARGVAGGANLGEAIDMTRATARGDFLSGSPGLQGAIDRALDPVQDRIQSQFARAGRMGSGANQEVLTRGLSDAASNIAYQDYSRERQNQLAAQQNLAGLQAQQFGTQLSGLNALGALSGQDLARRMSGASALSAADRARMQRQMSAAQLAPQFADLDYQGAERLAAVGGAREQQAQAELQDSVNRYNFDQNVDAQKLRDYMALIGGGTVGSNSIQPVFRNPLASGLGGALGGAQLGSYFGNPMLGAIGGGLLGLM
jgi:hypothetical protein